MKHNLENTLKAVTGAGVVFVTNLVTPALFGLLAIMIIDWITGTQASHARGEVISSKRNTEGYQKKRKLLLGVLVGAMLDAVIPIMVTGVFDVTDIFQMGLPFASYYTVWAIYNELLSLVENMDSLGLPVPPAIIRYIHAMKKKVEAPADTKGQKKVDAPEKETKEKPEKETEEE